MLLIGAGAVSINSRETAPARTELKTGKGSFLSSTFRDALVAQACRDLAFVLSKPVSEIERYASGEPPGTEERVMIAWALESEPQAIWPNLEKVPAPKSPKRLTPEQKSELIERLSKGEKRLDLAREYRLHPCSVSRIARQAGLTQTAEVARGAAKCL